MIMTLVYYVTQEAGAPHHELLTGRTMMKISPIHSSVML